MQKGKLTMRSLITVAALGLSACATATGEVAPPPPPTAGMFLEIRYETGPCFGACPVYALTVSRNGSGVFEGRQHTAVVGTRSFTVTPEQFAAFRNRLEPYRPYDVQDRRIADPNCGGRVATDLPSVDIIWTEKGPRQHLFAYYGCDMERNAALFEALRNAPQALPQVQAMISRR